MKKKKKLNIKKVIFVFFICVFIVFSCIKGLSYIYKTALSKNFLSDLEISESSDKKYIGTVIIDAGHGGYDAGTTNGNVKEKDITLSTAFYLGNELEKNHVKVIYTRTNDEALSDNKIKDLDKRVELGKQHNGDMFISIHVNDFEKSTNVNGFEIYSKDDQSQSLAMSIQKEINSLNLTKNRGIQSGKSLHVLRRNTIPSVLIELGYIRSKDFAYLKDNAQLKRIAISISQGILNNINAK